MPRRRPNTERDATEVLQEIASDTALNHYSNAGMQCAHMKAGHCGRCARDMTRSNTSNIGFNRHYVIRDAGRLEEAGHVSVRKAHPLKGNTRREVFMLIEPEDARSIIMSGMRLSSRRYGKTLSH